MMQAPVGQPVTVTPDADRPAWSAVAVAALWALVGLGAALVAYNFSRPNSLYLDEAYILFNVLELDVRDYAGPLSYEQIAPFGFMAGVRGLIELMGMSLASARLLPAAAAVGAFAAFAVLVRRMAQPLPGLMMMLALVVSPELLLQALRVKPYTLDVLFCVLGLWVGLTLLSRRCGVKETVVASAVAAAGLWCSVSFNLVIAAVGLVVIGSRIVGRGDGEPKRDWPGLAVVAGVAAAAGAAHFFGVLKPQETGEGTAAMMYSYWAGGFLPRPLPRPDKFFIRLQLSFRDATQMVLPGLVVGMALLGAVAGIVRRDARAWLLVAPVAVAVAASVARAYPMQDRLALYLAPPILLLVAAGLAEVQRALAGRVGLVVMALFAGLMVSRSVMNRGIAPLDDQVTPVLAAVGERLEPDQTAYLYYAGRVTYRFYQEHLDPDLTFPEEQLVVGGDHRGDWLGYRDEIVDLCEGGRDTWLVFTHVESWNGLDEASFFDMLLSRHGTVLDTIEGFEARAVLWRPGSAEASRDRPPGAESTASAALPNPHPEPSP
ncbi:MAG: hypothetical protein AAFX76_09790 [Planctomycetota bacterium]